MSISKNFKWLLILTCAISGIFAITNVRDDANWFKSGVKLKNKFSGVVKGIFDINCETPLNGELVQGQCMNKADCTKNQGKLGGPCSLLGVCCVIEKTCNGTVFSKIAYFKSPAKVDPDCALTINTLNKDVCQIRLDFEEFELAQPTTMETQGPGNEMTVSSYQCRTDTFKVEEVKKNLGFTALCGNNKKQHMKNMKNELQAKYKAASIIGADLEKNGMLLEGEGKLYVPVGENQNKIVLRFNTKARVAGDNLPEPKWNIKIRQLECQKGVLDQYLNAPSKLMAIYQSLKDKKRKHQSDYDLIAPPNCLQYYPEKSGQFESFNYNNGNGFYIGPMNYAICFRKTPDTCAIKYTYQDIFDMNYNPFQAGMPVDDRCHPRSAASQRVSQDYIRIHGGVNSANEFKDYFCDSDFNPQSSSITSKSIEPYFVGVNTDAFLANGEVGNPHRDEFQEIGFRLNYELDSVNCS